MEVLFITHKYPPSIGGMEKQSYQLIKGISKRCKTHTIIYDQAKESRITFFLLLKRRIKKILKQNPQIDLIHLNDGLMAAFTTWLADYTEIPVVATFHGLDVVFPLGYFQRKVIPQFKYLSGCMAVSESTKQELLSRSMPSGNVYKINNGVDHNLINHQVKPYFKKKLEAKIGSKISDKKILITMGRPVKRKGFTWFVENVLPNLPEDVILLIIGPFRNQKKMVDNLWGFVPTKLKSKIELFLGLSSDQNELRKLLKNERLKHKVFHLGKMPFGDVLQTISLGDIFVMPNIKVEGDAEGFGLVALESSILGTPVLASDIEGIIDAIQPGCNGWLIKSGDQEEWIYSLYQLLEDKTKLKDFSLQAQSYTSQNFDWELMVSEYYYIFKSIVQKNTGGKQISEFKNPQGVNKTPFQMPLLRSKPALK